jgi:hypothetical protein
VTLRTSDPLGSFERLHLEPSRAPKCPILDPLTVLQLSLRSPLTLSVTVGNVFDTAVKVAFTPVLLYSPNTS